MNQKIIQSFFILITLLFSLSSHSKGSDRIWMKIFAPTKEARSLAANMGAAIEGVKEEYVYAVATENEYKNIQKVLPVEVSFALSEKMLDFPKEDQAFHNYKRLTDRLFQLQQENPYLMSVVSIGKTNEFRDIWAVRLSTEIQNASQKAGIVFMGNHHAREHLSLEIPLMLLEHLIKEFKNGQSEIVKLLRSRDIHIIPMVNPDGAEFDIKGDQYKSWRKNKRLNADKSFGVDLNRNYSYQWGTGGSSDSPSSDVYKGPKPFSEPETAAIKDYLKDHTNISILLTFHSYSELILYPWGHKYAGIEKIKDKQVHETLAKEMAKMNGYTPQQSSALYIASGDTTDWSYGELGIISFTFELDPDQNSSNAGFYPGARVIPEVFNKNLPACLYLIDYADNPYRVLKNY